MSTSHFLIYGFTHLPILPFTVSLINCFTHIHIYPFTHLLIHPFTHSPIHPFTVQPIWYRLDRCFTWLILSFLDLVVTMRLHRFILPLPELSIYSASTGLNSLTGMLTVLLISFASTILSIASDTRAVKYFSPHC